MSITKLMEGLPNQSMAQAEFDRATGKLMAELPEWGNEANALAADVNGRQAAAAASAGAAAGSRDAALGYRDQAQAARDVANGYRDAAQTARDVAGGYRDQAQASASAAAASAAAAGTSTIATSTSQVVVGNGSKTFTIPSGKQFAVDQPVVAASGANRMFGTVLSYSGTTLMLTVTASEGSGTFSSWTISPSGAPGTTGGTAGGTLIDAINEKKGVAPASSATPDIWGAGGNYVPITQTAAITGFPNAPQAGARRSLFVVNGLSLISGTSLKVRGGTRVLAPGDEVEIVADTVSTFYATIKRGSGLPLASQVYMHAEMYTASGSIPLRAAANYRAILVGAGGSGAIGRLQTASTLIQVTGGGAGGMAIKDFSTTSSSMLSFMAGAPGAGISGDSLAANGNSGGTSTLVGAGISLTAGGGMAGGSNNSNVVAYTLLGNSGGHANGGDFNVPGGGSGSCISSVAGSGYSLLQATGGGSVGWKGVGYPSGDVTSPTDPGSNIAAASGGAGVGGKSGNVIPSGAGNAYTGGGGSLAASPDNTTVGSGADGPGQSAIITAVPFVLNGTGSGGANGNGGGSPAALTISVAAGMMGGSGAVANFGTSNSRSGSPGLGAGSGGVASQSLSNASSAGGNSFCILLF